VIAYFDASAFLKLVIQEAGTERAKETWLEARARISSRLLYPEARAGLARARRMRRLGDGQLEVARRSLHTLIDDADLIDVTDGLTRHAGELAERYGLRAYDAVHLATVDRIADENTVLVATDADLVRAAQARGISTSCL
jgi:hypothetical protein